ncbi:MAG: universal stress protein [Bacteroidales bacterium]|jgi:nucleotide-binding universal stress UspA family protein|nr:universal stress protein [Bacteroidales bacterium]
MKTIISAVDFSDCSINALEHAVSIAKHSGSDLLMLWVNNPYTTKTILSSDLSDDLVEEVEHQFTKLINKYSSELPESRIDYIIREGKVYREVVNQARESEAWLIVAGTHGSSGFEELWMGSNANRIVTAAPCPIITIRSGVEISRKLERIVMPMDNTMETRQKVPFTSELASAFDAEVHVLAIYTTSIEEIRDKVLIYAKQAAKYLKENGVRSQIVELEAENLSTVTIEYARKIDANLISIMTEQEKTAINLWLGPYAQQMVHHSPIPVLSIHPKEILISMGY